MAKPKVVVRRSPWKVMLVGLVGVPLVLFVIDYVWGVAGLFDRVIEWAYGAKDPEPFEPRDDILAALLGVVGAGMVVFALKELLAPRRLLTATNDGLRIPLSGPFARKTDIGWLQVNDIEVEPRAVLVELANAGGVPADPWGARWEKDRTLRLPTWWWDRPAEQVLDEIARKGLPDEARKRRDELLMEESRAHAAAMELVSGAAVVADPTRGESEGATADAQSGDGAPDAQPEGGSGESDEAELEATEGEPPESEEDDPGPVDPWAGA